MVTIPSTILITGANSGIGFEASRQVALKDSTTKVILGCRNEEKAKAAKAKLEEETGRQIFEILIVDVMKLASVRKAVSSLEGSIDCLVLNAGGPGGKDFVAKTEDGVAAIMALNVVGQALLVNELIDSDKLTKGATVMYASSEAARGVDNLGFPAPKIKDGSVEEFKSAIDGAMFVDMKDTTYETTYSWAKCIGVLWASSMVRKQPDHRFVSVSPGMTNGTNILNDLGFIKRVVFSMLGPILKFSGIGHGVDAGAKRYLDTVYMTDKYENGVFYGSAQGKFTGELEAQTEMFPDIGKEAYQDNAYAAIQEFLKE